MFGFQFDLTLVTGAYAVVIEDALNGRRAYVAVFQFEPVRELVAAS